MVVPDQEADGARLHLALSQLAEQDPLIDFRRAAGGDLSVSLYGEVQKEVIAATLAADFGVAVTFRKTTTRFVERPLGTGAAAELIGTEANPFLATVGLRVEPTVAGAGISYGVAPELRGTMPLAFFAAVEETVRETLGQGPYGWPVIDVRVTLTHTGYYPRQSHAHATFDKSMSSTAGDFRNLTPLVLMDALVQARTTVFEPVHRFRLEIPSDTLNAILGAFDRLAAAPQPPTAAGPGYVLEGDVPAAQVHRLTQLLPTLTRGEGVMESAFDHYQPVRGTPPTRLRTDQDPLHRKDYLLRVLRRVG